MHGGKPVFVPLTYPEFSYIWELVKKQIKRKTRAIIINTPHNPSGKVLTEADMKELSNLTYNKDLFIIADEVYEHILYDGRRHESVCRYPELASRSFIISSFGKVLHITGWRVGYCIAPAALTAEFRKIHQYMTFLMHRYPYNTV